MSTGLVGQVHTFITDSSLEDTVYVRLWERLYHLTQQFHVLLLIFKE